MGYLLPAEYEGFGLLADTADSLVTMASALMEGHCRRATLLSAEYVERARLSAGSQTVRLSYGPLLVDGGQNPLVSVRVRYARGRRGEAAEQGSYGFQIATAFGLPGTWTQLDVSTIDVDAAARELLFAANFLGIGYNEVEVTYNAGLVTVPDAVKAACAQIVRNAQATPALNVSRTRLDTMQMEYFSGVLIDEGVRGILRPYVAEKLG